MSPIIKVVEPVGILDGTKVEDFRAQVKAIVAEPVDVVLVNLQQVTFIDSSGLGGLVSALKTVQTAGAKFYICAPNNQVKIVFELSGLDRVFKIYPNQEELEQSLVSA